MVYTIQEHGDILEKTASKFISEKFSNYELVWQNYIGHKGRGEKANIPNYPYEEKRTSFAENSYSTLESIYFIQNILESKIFIENINDFTKYLDFNKSFILFFACLGRMHDTVIKASDSLGYDNTKFRKSIHKFYEARSVIIHGKKIPFSFDELGLIQVPIIKTEVINGDSWDDRHFNWTDGLKIPFVYVDTELSEFFDELLLIINNEYNNFYNIIKAELSSLSNEIAFEYNPIRTAKNTFNVPTISGTSLNNNFDVSGSVNYLGIKK